MRKLSITLADKEYELLANFQTSLEIAKKIGDPLWMAREAMLENVMLERNLTYTPKFSFTVENIADILYIGAKAADDSLKKSTIQEAVFDTGFFEARTQAIEYLSVIIGPQPEETGEDVNSGDSSGK